MDYSVIKEINNEKNIDIKELFWRIVEQWRAIAIIAIISMLLFSSFMFSRATMSQEEKTDIKTADDILSELSSTDQEKIIGVIKEREARDKAQKYISESPLMSIDPYNVCKFSITWLVNSDEKTNKQIVSAYMDELASREIAASIDSLWGGKYGPDLVKDLIYVTSGINIETEAELDSNTIKFTVLIPEDCTEDGIIGIVENNLPAIEERILSSIGDHQLTFAYSDVKMSSDQILAELQYNVYNRFYNLNSQLNTIVNGLSSEQKSVYDRLSVMYSKQDDDNDIVYSDDHVSTEKVSFFNLRYLAIGLIVGCFIYLCVYLAYYLLSDRVFSVSILESHFGMRILGEWYSEHNGGILRTILRDKFIFKRRHKGHTDIGLEINRIIEPIENALEENQRLLLVRCSVSDDDTETSETLTTLLEEKLKDSHITVELTEVNVENGITLGEKSILSNDAIVIVTNERQSKVKDVKEIYSKCNYCNKPVLGGVYIA